MTLSDIGEAFEQAVKFLASLFLRSDAVGAVFQVAFSFFVLSFLIRILYRFVMGDSSFSFFDWITEKFKRNGKIIDKAENEDLMHTVQDHEPFVRSIKIVNVLLDRVMFEYVGDYAISERKDTMTIYYNENGEAKQFSFNKSPHIEVYEDAVE